jgi:hypothetical protein
MFQTLSIQANYLVVFASHGIYLGIYFEIYRICPAICPEIYLVGKNTKKIMVSHNFCQTQIMVDHAPLSIVYCVGLHVDFSSTNFFFWV